jgi:hypothetical protein
MRVELTFQDTKQENPYQLEYNTAEDDKATEASPGSPPAKQPITPQKRNRTPRQSPNLQNRHSWVPENLNVRVVLEHQYPQAFDPRRFSYSPSSNQEPTRHPSIRRKKSRTGLKEYGATQALHEMAQNPLDMGNRGDRSSAGDRLSGYTVR